jgi:hypothetical protein
MISVSAFVQKMLDITNNSTAAGFIAAQAGRVAGGANRFTRLHKFLIHPSDSVIVP